MCVCVSVRGDEDDRERKKGLEGVLGQKKRRGKGGLGPGKRERKLAASGWCRAEQGREGERETGQGEREAWKGFAVFF
jgi:hypothetical protein